MTIATTILALIDSNETKGLSYTHNVMRNITDFHEIFRYFPKAPRKNIREEVFGKTKYLASNGVTGFSNGLLLPVFVCSVDHKVRERKLCRQLKNRNGGG